MEIALKDLQRLGSMGFMWRGLIRIVDVQDGFVLLAMRRQRGKKGIGESGRSH